MPDQARVFASPVARRLAQGANLDLRQLTGTGPGGRVVRSDVARAIVLHAPRPRRPAVIQQPTAVPHVYLRAAVRVDRLLALRRELNEALPVRISVNDLILKAAAAAHTAVPDVNVIRTETGLRRCATVNLAVAMASPNGLVAPVITDVGQLSISTLTEATRDLARRAGEGRLNQSELEGGACTVSNLGMFGIDEFAATVSPPQSSILAVGAARPEADASRGGRVRVRTKIRVVLSVDRRAIGEVSAAQWMSAFRDAVETPIRLLTR